MKKMIMIAITLIALMTLVSCKEGEPEITSVTLKETMTSVDGTEMKEGVTYINEEGYKVWIEKYKNGEISTEAFMAIMEAVGKPLGEN